MHRWKKSARPGSGPDSKAWKLSINDLPSLDRPKGDEIADMIMKAALLNYEGEVEKSYNLLQELRSIVEGDDRPRRLHWPV